MHTLSPLTPAPAPPELSAKRSEQLALAIEREIIALSWPVNHVLGMQSELMKRYGVGRSTLRVAIRVLEQRGVARMRSGPRGGLTVAAPAESAVVELITTHLELAGISTEEMLEARQVTEQLAVELAAQRIDGATLDSMRHVLAQLETAPSREESLQLLCRMQHLIGRASRNPALQVLVDALTRVNRDYLLHDAASVAHYRRIRRWIVALQTDVVAALAAGDAEQAKALVRRYIDESGSVKTMRPVETVAAADLRRAMQHLRSSIRKEGGAGPGGAKLAEVTARGLQREIQRMGWPLGLHLGSEADVARQLEISGSVLREAASILQQHGLIRVVNGRGGGLMVSAPDSANICRSAVLYLDFMRFGQDAYLPLRRALDAETARLAARRHDQADRERLLALVSQPPAADISAAWTAVDAYQQALAKSCKNRVIEFMQRIMLDLKETLRQPERNDALQRASGQRAGQGFPAWVQSSYGRIVAAVLDRDETRAGNAVLQHFEQLSAMWSDARYEPIPGAPLRSPSRFSGAGRPVT